MRRVAILTILLNRQIITIKMQLLLVVLGLVSMTHGQVIRRRTRSLVQPSSPADDRVLADTDGPEVSLEHICQMSALLRGFSTKSGSL